jgi:hypothetical protein
VLCSLAKTLLRGLEAAADVGMRQAFAQRSPATVRRLDKASQRMRGAQRAHRGPVAEPLRVRRGVQFAVESAAGYALRTARALTAKEQSVRTPFH